jgi:16S rRNA (cytosine1402-N4)-methyltransferase
MEPRRHIPVLADDVLAQLQPRAGALYCDATVGAGGHAERILETGARLVGLDRDQVALAEARRRLAPHAGRLTLVHARFGQVREVLDRLGIAPVDGFVADLGVSSMQIDDPARGFSFSAEGPIDMRMDPDDPEGATALDLLRQSPTDELERILRDYGEERYARRLAARLKEAARAGRLQTTLDLARLVAEAIPAKSQQRSRIHPATRTFQALRIAVNRELEELEAFLEVFPDLLAPGGRCAIVSFHSLEDRLVKHRFRDLARVSSLPPHLAEAAGERVAPICRLITRKAIFPGEEEVAANPRARSARLRACEKVG